MLASKLTFNVTRPTFCTRVGARSVTLPLASLLKAVTLTLRSLHASQLGSLRRCRKGRLRETDEGDAKGYADDPTDGCS